LEQTGRFRFHWMGGGGRRECVDREADIERLFYYAGGVAMSKTILDGGGKVSSGQYCRALLL
jgi:hypothetical protein